MSKTDDFLMHYGVKGMKWGRRKSHTVTLTSADGQRTADVTINPRHTKIVSGPNGEHTFVTTSKKDVAGLQKQADRAKIKLMSDEEIRTRVARLNMEKQLTDLMYPAAKSNGQAQVQKKSENIAKEVLKQSGKQVATTLATAGMTYLAALAVKKTFGPAAAAAAFPKGKKK